jgi:hypothetical protein
VVVVTSVPATGAPSDPVGVGVDRAVGEELLHPASSTTPTASVPTHPASLYRPLRLPDIPWFLASLTKPVANLLCAAAYSSHLPALRPQCPESRDQLAVKWSAMVLASAVTVSALTRSPACSVSTEVQVSRIVWASPLA